MSQVEIRIDLETNMKLTSKECALLKEVLKDALVNATPEDMTFDSMTVNIEQN